MSEPTPLETTLRRTHKIHEGIAVEHHALGKVVVWEVVGYVPWRGGIVESVRLLRTEPLPSRKGLRS